MASLAKARTSILLLLFGCAFCFCAWHPVRSRSSRPVARRSSDKQEIVYNYFAQDYALVTRKEETFDVGQWLSELLPWSDGELRARDVLSEILPKWRSIDVGPQTDIALRRRFRALTAATGGEEPALAAMRRNIAILYFGEGQIQRAGDVLQRLLGKERAAQVIQKNPGVLTIDPRNLENNISAVCVAADVIDVLVQNGQVARLTAGAVGIFFAVGIAKALGDVIYLRTLPREDEKELTFRMAKSLGIHDLPPDEAVQVLWWSKVLIDDPLRICRALRFAAKFKFKLHPAFWKAAPFALERGPRTLCEVLHMFLAGDYRNCCRRACILALGILSPGFGSCGLHPKPMLARTSQSQSMAAEEAPVPTPKAALLLIDLQKAFTVGSWASHFGGKMQVVDIERACAETARLLQSGKVPPDTPILCTKCYDSMPCDEPYVDVVEPFLRKVPCIHKPTMDVTYNPAFFRWLQQQVRCGVNVLVIGGCTTTSCVRVRIGNVLGEPLEQSNLKHKLAHRSDRLWQVVLSPCDDMDVMSVDGHVVRQLAGMGFEEDMCSPDNQAMSSSCHVSPPHSPRGRCKMGKAGFHPFLRPLRTKVAGSRKFTEYQKIGGYGFKACFEFFELAFSYTFGPGEGCSRLASALLGGQDDKAKPRMLSQVHTFDRDCFRTLADAVQLCEGQKHDGVELLGELMVAAIAAAQFEADGDPVAEFTTACDGMCVSNAMREAGLTPLNASIAMAAEAPSLNALDIHVADACGISLDSLGRHVQVWEAMQICNSRTGPEYATPYRRQLALALVRLRAPDMAAEVQACFEQRVLATLSLSLEMPAWKELLGKTLTPTCQPKVKLHFQERKECDIHDPMTVFARSRGCKIVNAEVRSSAQTDFSVIMCHDNVRDLAAVPPPSTGKGKKGPKKKKSKKNGPSAGTLYKCWAYDG
eukprot:s1008_g10.t3